MPITFPFLISLVYSLEYDDRQGQDNCSEPTILSDEYILKVEVCVIYIMFLFALLMFGFTSTMHQMKYDTYTIYQPSKLAELLQFLNSILLCP